ncbi:outer membrane beta-barrel protein [Polaribacter sp. IC073]|uniref:outer membrane beta-barrel protein n=1 Tax=Polaribacter sp. IC073 TaxID=2508540 RepID=UPI0011BFDF39|nr:outer membrane beta-barrel protein [Polaribacter sp. IC073]TXD48946.1 outer membrane beta-barrel protein [Polaribacter sp. IC073]
MKKIIFTLLIASSLIATGQEKENKGTFTLSGSVDTYYATNLSTSGLGNVGILSDVAANGFGLGMVNTIFSYEKGKVGVVADLAYGPRATAANAYTGAINQLYAYYNASEKVTFSLGQFNTFLGYEVISPVGNFNYTVSYLFNAGPFSHTGLKIDYAASEDLSFMFAVTNPHTEISGANQTDTYQLGFQTGYKGQFLNLVYGADGSGVNDALYVDYTGGFNLSDSFFFGINAAFANADDADAGYQGVALYLQNTFSDTFSLGIRPEFYTTTSGTGDASQSAFTLTGNTNITNTLRLVTEVRYDTSDDVTFFGDHNVTGLTIAAVYSF